MAGVTGQRSEASSFRFSNPNPSTSNSEKQNASVKYRMMDSWSLHHPVHKQRDTQLQMQNFTMSLRILSFSILSFSFFCSRSVLAWYVATAFVSFWILPVTDRWYSLKSLACWRMLLRYSYKNTQVKTDYCNTPCNKTLKAACLKPRGHNQTIL